MKANYILEMLPLWEIHKRVIAAGLELLNEDKIEQELALRRGGTCDS